MENASKALVIAGAILATLMIIGLGIVIINNVTGVINGAGVDKQAASANNSQYESLMGASVSSATVKQLLTTIRTNNISAETNDEDMKRIAILDGTNIENPGEFKVTAGKRYTVDVPNEKTSDKDPVGIIKEKGGDAQKTAVGSDDQGYYKNGNIRIIRITVNNSSPTPTP